MAETSDVAANASTASTAASDPTSPTRDLVGSEIGQPSTLSAPADDLSAEATSDTTSPTRDLVVDESGQPDVEPALEEHASTGVDSSVVLANSPARDSEDLEPSESAAVFHGATAADVAEASSPFAAIHENDSEREDDTQALDVSSERDEDDMFSVSAVDDDLFDQRLAELQLFDACEE